MLKLERQRLPKPRNKRKTRKPKQQRRLKKRKLDELLPRAWPELKWRRIEWRLRLKLRRRKRGR